MSEENTIYTSIYHSGYYFHYNMVTMSILKIDIKKKKLKL